MKKERKDKKSPEGGSFPGILHTGLKLLIIKGRSKTENKKADQLL